MERQRQGNAEALGVTEPTVGSRLNSKERRQARGRVLPLGAAPGVRRCHPSGAKGLRRSHSPGGKASCSWSLCPKVEGTARVLPSLAGPQENRAGATPQGGELRAAEVNRGYPRGVTRRQEAREEGGWGPPGRLGQ